MNKFIKKSREEAGLTQAKLAEKMGVSIMSVQNWENGRSKPELNRYMILAEIFNIPVEKLIKETLIEEDKKRPNNWPDFLFDDDTNSIIDTLHLNLCQQDLLGLLYIYEAEYIEKQERNFNTLYNDLKKIPYGFIEKVGSIRFLNQAEDLHRVIQYIKTDFLIKVLKQNSVAEFNIKKLSKSQICEFIDSGHKPVDETALYFDDPEIYEGSEDISFPISMKKAHILLPALKENGPVHITDGFWSQPIRNDIPESIVSAIFEMCDFNKDLWKEGYYKKEYNIAYIRNGLEIVTDYYNSSKEGREECWMWEINKKGIQLLNWFQEK